MPKLPKAFTRRKSAANALEESFSDVPLHQQSFKVFERTNTGSTDLGKSRPRLSTEPGTEDNIFSGLSNRGSGTSNSNTVSTTDNSSRHSAVSTSSSDPTAQPDYRKNNGAPLPAIPKGTSKFSLISTGKAFSFGRKSSGSTPSSSTQEDLSKPPTPAKDDTTRSSTLTDSAKSDYSSTTASLKLDNRLSLGGDFAAMFAVAGNRKSAVMDAENQRAASASPGASSQYTQQGRALTQTQESSMTTPRPGVSRKPLGNVSNERSLTGDAWGGQKSAEKQRLMFSTSPGPSPSATPPPVPEHEGLRHEPKRSDGFSNGGLRRSSAVRRQSLIPLGDGEDEDAKLMRESISAMRRLNVDDTPRARESWINPSAVAAFNDEASTPRTTTLSSNNTTPRVRYPAAEPKEDGLFDQQAVASANLAMQWGERASVVSEAPVPKNKVMTTAQFERYRQDQERQKRFSAKSKNDDDDAEDDTYEDEDDDEEERRRAQAKQRRKQEAHMTVYRQQMMKITGETPNPSARPSAVSSQSAPNLQIYSDNPAADEDEDEDIPLAILAAHGFPNRTRAPGQLGGMSSNPNLRASSQMSSYPPPPRSVTGGAGDRGSTLPPFARRLPQDPYFGAGLVNPANRESLALGSGSQYGGGQQRAQPGGLVGVIASEERSRAMRRGSPNPAGEYPAMPPGMGLGYAGGARTPGGQGFPTDPAAMQAQMAAMQAQLQQSMEMQFQFFQLMAGAGPEMQMQMPPGMMNMMQQQQGMPMPMPGGAPPQIGRTSTMGSSLGFNGFPAGPRSVSGATVQRPLTMFDSGRGSVMGMGNGGGGVANGGGGVGYAPSIAPSERSNVGMPDRYRPVSQVPVISVDAGAGAGGRASGMGMSSLGKVNNVTVRAVDADAGGGEKEEDEEVAWEEMKRQKEKKKSMWRMKKERKSGLEELGELARFTS